MKKMFWSTVWFVAMIVMPVFMVVMSCVIFGWEGLLSIPFAFGMHLLWCAMEIALDDDEEPRPYNTIYRYLTM